MLDVLQGDDLPARRQSQILHIFLANLEAAAGEAALKLAGDYSATNDRWIFR
jgi:hypothetical protein